MFSFKIESWESIVLVIKIRENNGFLIKYKLGFLQTNQNTRKSELISFRN